MVAAYVLVKFAPGADIAKAQHALQEPGVKSVEMIMGPWDFIVRCEAADLAALGEIAKAIRGCPGVHDSMTCPVI